MKLTRLSLALVLVPCLALISCARQADEGSAGETMEMAMAVDMEELGTVIAEATDAFIEAYETGDAAALAAMYTEDGMRMAPNQETVRGQAAIEAVYTGLFENSANRAVTMTPFDYGASGDLAYTAGTYTSRTEVDGEAVTDEGKYITVARLMPDGTYKILCLVWNSSLPAE
jgi:ketosteroid isomerase-like protein